MGVEESEQTTCETCGAAVVAPDRHEDWHRQLVTVDQVDDRIAKAFDVVSDNLTNNP